MRPERVSAETEQIYWISAQRYSLTTVRCSRDSCKNFFQVRIFLVVLPDKTVEYVVGDLGNGEQGQGQGLADRRMQGAERIGKKPLEESASARVTKSLLKASVVRSERTAGPSSFSMSRGCFTTPCWDG